jgi:serine-type D-Ala-D-Ala carboxypeptidase/endopeptidase (penicillin-binding protein 4)
MRILFLLALGLLCPLAFAQPDDHLPTSVSQALAAAHIPTSAVGIVVQEAGSAGPRLSINADQAMNPASVIKLVTTFTALELLGPAYTWKTGFWSQAPIVDGTLKGDLYLRGGADPKLTFEQFWLLLRQLRARGVRLIEGDLVLDRTLIAGGDYDPAAFDEKPLRPYNVGPDALLLNFKAIRFTLVPAGDRVQVLAQPEPANLDIVDDIRLADNGCGDWKENLHADLSHQGQRWRLILSGRYPASCGENDWNLSVMPHADYVRGVFEQLWRELGGNWQGKLRDGAVPVDAREIASIESPPLAEVIRDINKYSNNVMARQLFLTIGAETGKRPAGVEDADTAVRAWLDAHDLHMPELVFDNGAGLSRRDRISAGSLARLLAYAWKSPVMPEFVASLPLAAVDGTMKKRLNGDGVAGQAHIKTGTLDGVKSIAGYVLDRDGHQHVVVFLVNHADAGAAQAAQDALLDWVYQGGR